MLYELKLLISLTEPEVKSVESAHFLIKWAKASEPIDPLRLCYAMLTNKQYKKMSAYCTHYLKMHQKD